MPRELLFLCAHGKRRLSTVAVLVLVTRVTRARAIDAQTGVEKELVTQRYFFWSLRVVLGDLHLRKLRRSRGQLYLFGGRFRRWFGFFLSGLALARREANRKNDDKTGG
jgi:hypothetical protein